MEDTDEMRDTFYHYVSLDQMKAARRLFVNLGVLKPGMLPSTIDVQKALMSSTCALALADFMRGLLNEPSPLNLENFGLLAERVQEAFNSSNPDTSNRALYVIRQLGQVGLLILHQPDIETHIEKSEEESKRG